MLKAGLVRVRRSELRTRYRELQADAQKRKVGIWDTAAKL
jgi:endonuclease YncB( thermonuclease family)